jgi:hypothetical protein
MPSKWSAKFPLADRLALSGLALGLAGLGIMTMTGPSKAVVYCKRVGYPVGCVVRPAAPVVYCQNGVYVKGCVARPAPRVVYCKRVGYPKGCVVR